MWVVQLQIDIILSTKMAEYIAMSQAMRGVLLFVGRMK